MVRQWISAHAGLAAHLGRLDEDDGAALAEWLRTRRGVRVVDVRHGPGGAVQVVGSLDTVRRLDGESQLD